MEHHHHDESNPHPCHCPPRLGEPAPDFKAVTTHGPKQLSDYRGRWVVLFSHPGDFTPVCTTEFISFSQHAKDFEQRDTQLIGLSVDSLFSHIAWARNIEEKFGVKVSFPIIADLRMEIANLYGMVQPEADSTATVRTVFFIDPQGVLQAMLYYPLTNGRNIDEILRLLDALQFTQKHKVATPANWKPGDQVLVPPPTTQEGAAQRSSEQGCTDWYFCKKKVEE